MTPIESYSIVAEALMVDPKAIEKAAALAQKTIGETLLPEGIAAIAVAHLFQQTGFADQMVDVLFSDCQGALLKTPQAFGGGHDARMMSAVDAAGSPLFGQLAVGSAWAAVCNHITALRTCENLLASYPEFEAINIHTTRDGCAFSLAHSFTTRIQTAF